MNFDAIKSESSIIHAFPFNSEKKRGGVAVKRLRRSLVIGDHESNDAFNHLKDNAGSVKLWEITRGVVIRNCGPVSFEMKEELFEMVSILAGKLGNLSAFGYPAMLFSRDSTITKKAEDDKAQVHLHNLVTIDLEVSGSNHYQDNKASASSKPVNLELIFPSRVASPVYTGRRISGEVHGGTESIEIINIWTHQEFKEKIVVNWKNKKNLLLGNLSLVHKNGIGTVGEMRIKHDSKPLKNVKFRLGAMVDDDNCPFEIKEAITNHFEVKDRRNESMYLGPLSPNDWVWKLVNISKKGPIRKRLESKNVSTVRDFLNIHALFKPSSTPTGLWN
nr:hypothetical protein [Tanacetum cinerariifolium]